MGWLDTDPDTLRGADREAPSDTDADTEGVPDMVTETEAAGVAERVAATTDIV